MSRISALGYGALAFARYTLARYNGDACLRIAASLSYTSLLALVPLVAIAVAVLSAFPVFNGVRADLGILLLSYVAPHAGAQVQGAIDQFVVNTGQLTTLGVVGLAVVAVMLLATVEAALNTIWRVRERRAWVARLMAYWTLLTLGPLLLAAGLSLSSTVLAGARLAGLAGELGNAREVLARVAPLAFAVLGFTALYTALPNRHVSIRHAAAGGLVAALLFEALKIAFGVFVAGIASVHAIYGALAALPLFLTWMYFTWAIVLFGAVVVAAWPEWLAAQRDTTAPPQTPVSRLARALQILAALEAAARAGGPTRADDLLAATNGDREGMMQAVVGLEDGGYVARTQGGELVLARDVGAVTLYELYSRFGVGPRRDDVPMLGEAPWGERFTGLLEAATTQDHDVLDVPLAVLFAGVAVAPQTTGATDAKVDVISLEQRGRQHGGSATKG